MASGTPFDIAFKYHTMGRCVIPSGGGEAGKKALVPWLPYQAKPPDDEQLQTWEMELQPKVWAMVTGAVSNVFVIDCDSVSGEQLLNDLKPHIKTPRGGSHYYFKLPANPVHTRAAILPSVDVRGEGGYVNFCGAGYEVLIWPTDENLYSIDQLSPDLRTALYKKSDATAGPANKEIVIKEGNRNSHLTSIAGSLRKRGIGQKALTTALLEINSSQCDPPLSEAEVINIAKSVTRYPSSQSEQPEPIVMKAEHTGRVFHFTWEGHGITVHISRIKEQHNGDWRGLVDIYNSNLPLRKSMLNLSIDSARNALVKSLPEKKGKVVLPWGKMINDMCGYILTELTYGEPIETISTDDEIPSLQYLISPLLPLNQPTIIFAKGGSCKSYIAQLLSVIGWLPWRDNPLGWTAPYSSVPQLYLDWETDKATFAYRLKRIARGMGLPEVRLDYRHCTHTLVDDIEAIQQHILDTGAKFVVIDSAGLACGGDLTQVAVVNDFFSAVRDMGTTTLIIHHESRTGEDFYGSAYFENNARNMWRLQKAQSPGENSLTLAFNQTKVNEMAKMKPFGIEVSFDNEFHRTVFAKTDLVGTELESTLPIRDRISNLLRRGPLTEEEIVDEVGVNKGSVHSKLYTHKDTFIKVGNRWGLRSQELF